MSDKKKLKATGFFNLPNLETKESSNQETEKPRNLETKESSNQETEKLRNLETKESSNQETKESKNLEIEESRNLETEKSRNLETLKSSNQETKKNQGYMIDQELIGVLGIYTAFTGRDKSEIVRAALRAYIPPEFFSMWRGQADNK